MTPDQAVEYLRRFTLHGGLRTWGAELKVSNISTLNGTVSIKIQMLLHDRDDDQQQIPTTFEERIDAMFLERMTSAEGYLKSLFLRVIRTMVNHEIHESIQFDGRRLREVHDAPRQERDPKLPEGSPGNRA